MRRLLIVDNEPNIVRGLKQLLAEESAFELDVYGALSAEEALSFMNQTKIDIALLDIRMPGMNGLELQAEIAKKWPACKAVFLSGYDDFSYVQTAMRSGGVDYILKMDGDDAILQAIGKALDELEQSGASELLLTQARTQWMKSLGARQNEYIRQLVGGLSAVRSNLFADLQIPLLAEQPALLLVARVDRFDPSHSAADKSLLLYAVQNIASEHWSGFPHFSAMPESSLIAAFVQPTLENLTADDVERWSRNMHGRFEGIQEACKRYLNLPVSIASSTGLIEWNQLPSKYAELKQMLFYGFGSGEESLLTDSFKRNFGTEQSPRLDETVARNKLRRLLSDDPALEHRILSEFDELAELSRNTIHSRRFHAEFYHGICYLLLSSEENEAAGSESGAQERLSKLLSLNAHDTWEAALAYLREEIVKLVLDRERANEDGTHFVVGKLKNFIEGHLHEDLSLVRLSDIVFLNPTYLSRLFKQQTGHGVSEFTAGLRLEKSKELLRYTQIKIQDIAGKVGFDSATSFGRFFKRETNTTPQEFREADVPERI